MLKQWTRTTIAATALAFLLAGCGATSNQYNPNDPYGAGYSDPYGSGGYGSDPYGSGSGGYGSDPYNSGSGSYTSGGSYNTGGSYTGGTTPGGYVGAPVGELSVTQIDKKSSGILFWKKLSVTGKVVNNTRTTLSGEVQISFMKKGKVVETQYDFVTDLQPGGSHSIDVKSKKSADDVQVHVTTSQPTTPINNGSSYGSGYGSSYGSGYGSSTGYGSNTGYDSSYGSGYGSGTGTGSGVGTGY